MYRAFLAFIVATFISGALADYTIFETRTTPLVSGNTKGWTWKIESPCSRTSFLKASRAYKMLWPTLGTSATAIGVTVPPKALFLPHNGCIAYSSDEMTNYVTTITAGVKQFTPSGVIYEPSYAYGEVVCQYDYNQNVADDCMAWNAVSTPAAYITVADDKCASTTTTIVPTACHTDGAYQGKSSYSYDSSAPSLNSPHVMVKNFLKSDCDESTLTDILYFELNHCYDNRIVTGSNGVDANLKFDGDSDYFTIDNSGVWKVYSDNICSIPVQRIANSFVQLTFPSAPVVDAYGTCETLSDSSTGGFDYYVRATFVGTSEPTNEMAVIDRVSISGLVIGAVLGTVAVGFYGYSVFTNNFYSKASGDVEMTQA